MPKSNWRAGIDRRRLVKSGAALAAAQFASPFIVRARAADAVKIGLDNPLTGTYAGPGKNELVGCQMALDEINAKGGILGRPAELLVEDSSSGDAAAAVQKARKLIESDKVDFLLGNVNSGSRSPWRRKNADLDALRGRGRARKQSARCNRGKRRLGYPRLAFHASLPVRSPVWEFEMSRPSGSLFIA